MYLIWHMDTTKGAKKSTTPNVVFVQYERDVYFFSYIKWYKPKTDIVWAFYRKMMGKSPQRVIPDIIFHHQSSHNVCSNLIRTNFELCYFFFWRLQGMYESWDNSNVIHFIRFCSKYPLSGITRISLNKGQCGFLFIMIFLCVLHCFYKGLWRVLDFNFLSQVLNHIIQLCEENDWLSTGIPLEECVETLGQLFPKYKNCFTFDLMYANFID